MADDGAWAGGEVLFCGGTDWAQIGRGGGNKKKTEADKTAEKDRSERYPNLLSPVRLKSFAGVPVRFVAAGSAACHCILGDDQGRCFTWGRNEKGQLGLGDLTQRNVPTLIESLEGKDIIAGQGGRFHSAVVTISGQSYTFGSNKDGQLGTGTIKSKDKVEELITAPTAALVSDCCAVACGADFTLWLCDGKLFSAGMPQYGQLGHGTDHEYNAKDSSVKLMYQPQPTPKLIKALADHHIRRIACGHNHSLALNDKGQAFSWGNGGYGRLGHSVQQDEFTPKQIETLRNRMPVDPNSIAACGSTSSFCCMVGGQLCAWGKLKASGDNIMYPKPVYELSGWSVQSLACGATTFAAAATDGESKSVITWGQASNGELGYGPNGKKSSANPEKMHAVEGAATHQVAMGIGHCLLLVDPKAPFLDKVEVWEPQVLEEAPPLDAQGQPGKGRGRGAAGGGTKRKADAEPESKVKGRGKGRAKK